MLKMPIQRRALVAGAAVVLTALAPSLQGCNDSSRRSGAPPPSTVASLVSDRRVSFTPPNDVAFIDFFVPHHRAAIAMSDEVLARGQDAAVLALARRMRDAQTAEIAQMRTARAELTGSSETPEPPADAHMEADLALMRTLSGTALDQQFLDDMIPHHAAGIPSAHRALGTLQRSDMGTLAQSIVETQAREIGEMKALLSADSGPPPAPGTEAADPSIVGDVRVPYTPGDDVAFIDFFVPHHRAAIEMADEVIARGADPQVRALAQSMRDAQVEEIARMSAARAELTGSPEVPPPPPDRHMAADMAAMRGLAGLELDRRFLQEMIPHHSGALPAAHRGEPRLVRADMEALARTIYRAQAEEIGEMVRLLRALS